MHENSIPQLDAGARMIIWKFHEDEALSIWLLILL